MSPSADVARSGMSAYRLSMKFSLPAANPSEIGIDMGVKRFCDYVKR